MRGIAELQSPAAARVQRVDRARIVIPEGHFPLQQRADAHGLGAGHKRRKRRGRRAIDRAVERVIIRKKVLAEYRLIPLIDLRVSAANALDDVFLAFGIEENKNRAGGEIDLRARVSRLLAADAFPRRGELVSVERQ